MKGYNDYERVKKAFENFVHAVAWESDGLFEGLHEDAVNRYIKKFANENADRVIEEINADISLMTKNVENKRYEVYLHECNEHYDLISEIVVFTDDLEYAINRAMVFYKKAKKAHVCIFDNETKGNITELYE